MISYINGQVYSIINSVNNRVMVIVDVNGIGYEIQVTSRLVRKLNLTPNSQVQIFTHYQVREDKAILYGFTSSPERDLFRQLISVTGIGTQMAIALIDSLGLEELVQAIITGNTRSLCKTPGVGQKTADRIALELKTKLKQWRKLLNISELSLATGPPQEILEDLEITLLALGYTEIEIEQAIATISQNSQLTDNVPIEQWLKVAISHLSESV